MKRLLYFLIFVLMVSVVAAVSFSGGIEFSPSQSNVTYLVREYREGFNNITVNETCLLVNDVAYCTQSSVARTIHIYVPDSSGGGPGSYDTPSSPQASENVTEDDDVTMLGGTFLDRLRDKSKKENGICEDGETPADKDCELNQEAILCTGDRCIFTEIWFAKLLLIAIAFMVLSKKKNYNFFIAVIGFFIFFNFIGGTGMLNIETPEPSPDTEYTDAALKSNIVLLVGSKMFPSHPTAGFFIALALIYFLIIKGSRTYARGKQW